MVRVMTTSRNLSAGTSHDPAASLSTPMPEHLPYSLLANLGPVTLPGVPETWLPFTSAAPLLLPDSLYPPSVLLQSHLSHSILRRAWGWPRSQGGTCREGQQGERGQGAQEGQAGNQVENDAQSVHICWVLGETRILETSTLDRDSIDLK